MDFATLLFTLILGILVLSVRSRTSSLPPPCSSNIFCHGKLLHTIQMASLFPDSKTFVDMKLKQNSTITLINFNKLMNETEEKPSRNDVLKFLEENFEPPGSEFESWTPSDWHQKPKFLEKINDRVLKHWAEDLHKIWKMLGRKMKNDVMENPDLYSIIPIPNPVIVPGGRFREFYYWDSYWIVRGLLLSEMHTTVRGMLGNFISIVERYGFIPNGGRIYYLMRSQPPLLIPMFDSYVEFTKDFAFLEQHIKVLEREFDFWMQNHTVRVTQNDKVYTLCKYNDESSGPRPESYREDVLSAQYMKEDEKDMFYSQLKSAAESGWDFSSRWFLLPENSNKGNITNIKIKSIIPVDLNALIYWNAKILAKYFTIFNNINKADYYEKIAENWLEAVTAILWRPEVGVWLDYDLINNNKRDFFYPSNLSPLWTNCYPSGQQENVIDNVLKYIRKTGILRFEGGIPTSFDHSGEQWDYPNAWPPLQYIVIMGLDNTNNNIAKEMAYDLAEKWVRSNYMGYIGDNDTVKGGMYEKYDATTPGIHGGGGEYEVQLGFGWTNGVVMDLLNKYGDRIYYEPPTTNISVIATSTMSMSILSNKPITTNAAITSFNSHLGPILTLLLAMGATITAGCIGAIVYSKRHSPHRPDKSKYIKIPGHPNLT